MYDQEKKCCITGTFYLYTSDSYIAPAFPAPAQLRQEFEKNADIKNRNFLKYKALASRIASTTG